MTDFPTNRQYRFHGAFPCLRLAYIEDSGVEIRTEARGQLLWHSLNSYPLPPNPSHSCLSMLIFRLDVRLHIEIYWMQEITPHPSPLSTPLYIYDQGASLTFSFCFIFLHFRDETRTLSEETILLCRNHPPPPFPPPQNRIPLLPMQALR